MKRNSPGCTCCCKICWAIERGSVDVCLCGASNGKTNINADIDRLTHDACKLLFVGPQNVCNVWSYSQDNWETTREWVEEGGRLYVSGEFRIACFTNANKANLNDFLSAMGTGMALGERACNCQCTKIPSGDPWLGIPQPVQIMTDLPGLMHACTNEIIGGTPIVKTEPEGALSGCADSFPFVAGERIGDGIVIAAGDSNIFSGCGFDNCEFFKRLRDNDIDEIL